ncbi:elongation factor P [Candidatus Gottesmanbacteria bacterium RIFCSPHIGHO2_01_FULL_42_12]|uniref:Elongation factor P n=1 Tax=Candidatus Gottesmanbacteria bacterium RIFCSPHIGHO2_01_FULL_42_12 TaxID=1798377 RepID=A0A1F5Z181_9BACT|nr:MAG: elongation factor P [Candidatus Gottesmanbacteria bacterium RIFCSPHIGHO2_01_FULL_42_12]
MSSINAGDIKKGDYVIFKDAPCVVAGTEFMNPGKGSAIMRVRYKNLRTGSVQEYTHRTTEFVEAANVTKKEMQFLYVQGDDVVFMDPRTYDQAVIPTSLLEDKLLYLIPDLVCWTLWLDDTAIGVILPPNIVLTVTESQEAVAGNRVNAPKKEVVTETGLKVQAPLFIKEGERIIVSTDDGSYVSRAN